jgi:signal transduction histidine kinase
MLRQAQRLERLLGDMLDASQIDAGGLVIDLEAVPVRSLVARLVADFEGEHAGRRVTLDVGDRHVVALADPFRVEQVVLNLLTNADKYTPSGLPIDVIVRQANATAVISVRDQGDGIAPEHQDRIFDRFFRVNDGDGRRGTGTGLGLYIARSLVEAMGGRIWVASEQGEGSTFSFSLPIVEVGVADLTDDGPILAPHRNLMAV